MNTFSSLALSLLLATSLIQADVDLTITAGETTTTLTMQKGMNYGLCAQSNAAGDEVNVLLIRIEEETDTNVVAHFTLVTQTGEDVNQEQGAVELPYNVHTGPVLINASVNQIVIDDLIFAPSAAVAEEETEA